jgi:hypothetical protein
VSSPDEVREYFRHVVQEYSCGDVRALLSLNEEGRLDKAGPLLACVVNGIDLLGGMMIGFNPGGRSNSRERSVQFMTRHMGPPEEVAEMPYALVRCGVSHEGTTKLTLRYFVHTDALGPMKGHRLYRDKEEGSLWLDVNDLAHRYLEAVERIASEIDKHLHHVPETTKKDAALLGALSAMPFRDIEEYSLAALSGAERAEQEENIRLGRPTSSSRSIPPAERAEHKRSLPTITLPKSST